MKPTTFRKFSCRRVLTASLICLAASACTTAPQPGDYQVFRVAASSATLSDACLAGSADPSLIEDSTTLRTNGIFMLLAGPNDTYYLDVGGITLDGSGTDDDYVFSGTETDIEYSCSDGSGDKTTSTTTTTVNMAIDGAFVDGDLDVTTQFRCVGESCPADTDCSVKSTFIGNEVVDVELDQDVGKGDNSAIPVPVAGEAGGPKEPPVGYGGNCAPTCGHDECTVGGPLDPNCNSCAAIVCTVDTSCCFEGAGWSSSCIAIADASCGNNSNHCPAFP